MQIRRASEKDLLGIAEIHRAAIEKLCAARYTPEQIGQWLSALHADAYPPLLAQREMFVAEEGAVLQGFGVLDVTHAFVNATYVSPTATQRGVGRTLMETMEQRARTASATQISLHATLNAVGFYEQLGYARVAQTVNRLPSGLELPCVVMRKVVSS